MNFCILYNLVYLLQLSNHSFVESTSVNQLVHRGSAIKQPPAILWTYCNRIKTILYRYLISYPGYAFFVLPVSQLRFADFLCGGLKTINGLKYAIDQKQFVCM
eukprot:314692_1